MDLPERYVPELNDFKYINKWSKNIDGVFMPKKFMDIQSEVSDWKVNEEDVWVVSFPKTGKLKDYFITLKLIILLIGVK